MESITKAVFPVAGMGTRFLPATKASPKEMLPIVDKPLIQYAVDEATAAGIRKLIFIIGKGKQSIVEHFGKADALEAELMRQDKTRELDRLRNIVPEGVECVFIVQSQPLGLGHAVLCARDAVGDHPFAVILPDDLIDAGERGVMQQMVGEYEREGCSVIAVENVPKRDTGKYGIVRPADHGRRLAGIVEKPEPDSAPSTLAVVGRYILTAGIFKYLQAARPGAGGEIQLTDAIAGLLADEPVHAYEFAGRRYDCGSKLGYMRAAIDYALVDPDIGPALSGHIKDRLKLAG